MLAQKPASIVSLIFYIHSIPEILENFKFCHQFFRIFWKKIYLYTYKPASKPKISENLTKGKFEGFLVPHEETITIAKSLEVKNGEEIIYRPTVIFLYSPCDFAVKYLKSARVYDYLNSNITTSDNQIVRGFKYPKNSEIIYKENIKKGTEYVGVLLLGSKFKPVWVGNRIKQSFLYKDKKSSFWQTPTITPVAMSALAVTCWMIKNKDKGGIYFPDDISEYKEIINFAEKYISKTIYKTFNKKKIEQELSIDLDNLQIKDIINEKKSIL